MTTYGQLRTDVGAFLDRTTEVTNNFATIIRLTEAMIARKVRARAQVTETTLSATGATVALPTDFLQAVSIHRTDTSNPEVLIVEPNALRNSNYPEDVGPTVLVAFEGPNLHVSPPGTVASPSGFTLLYFARFAAMDGTDVNATNSLFTNQYDIVFAAAMSIAGKRFRDREMADRYELEFRRLVDEFHETENMVRLGGGPIQIYREVPTGGV